MTTKTVTIGKDGSLVVTKTDDDGAPTPPPPPGSEMAMPVMIRDHHRDVPPAVHFVLGVIVGMIVLLLVQRRLASRRHRPVKLDRTADGDRMAADVAALARRTATLETIVTDPAQRTAREIDALR